MSDRETEFIARWRSEAPIYSAWGKFVSETIIACLAEKLEKYEFTHFIRIPVTYRLKDEPSLLAKAFHRDKGYADPYAEIEDKVGTRVVVLLNLDIRIVETCIKECPLWAASMARDFEQERDKNPNVFDYQSLHYILRSTKSFEYDGTLIPPNLPCEVQIRTLLQHAYSELTHDTIYKPSVKAEPDVKRAVAKSMALIEATDDYFTQVHKRISELTAPGKAVAKFLQDFYKNEIGLDADIAPLNTLLVDHFKKWITDEYEKEIRSFIDEKKFIIDRIKEKCPTSVLYRQPAILLVYYAISQAPKSAYVDGPLSDAEIAPLYSDLGLRQGA